MNTPKHTNDDAVGGSGLNAGLAINKCPQCGNQIDTATKATIIDRAWDNVRRKQYARKQEKEFCSPVCASHYQMGCEG